MNLAELKEKTIAELTSIARTLNVVGASGLRKQELIFKILEAQTEKNGLMFGEGRAGDPARRLRLPAGARLQLPALARTTSTSPPRRSAASTCGPATRCPGRSARPRKASATSPCCKVEAINFENPELVKEKILFDNLTPLYPEPAVPAGDDRRRDLHARHGPDHADRQGPARADRRPAAHRQDDPAAEDRQQHHQEPSRGDPDRPAHRRAAGGSDRHGALREGRGRQLHLRRAGQPPRPGRRDGDREGQAPGRAQAGRGHPAGLDHPPGPRLQHRSCRPAARSCPAAWTPTPCRSPSASSAPPATSRRAAA